MVGDGRGDGLAGGGPPHARPFDGAQGKRPDTGESTHKGHP